MTQATEKMDSQAAAHPLVAMERALGDAYARVTGIADADPAIRPSQSEQFGDYQSNGVMSLAKRLNMKPRELAEKIVAAADVSAIAEPLEVAGPGFINIRLKNTFVDRAITILDVDARLGIPGVDDPPRVVIDYSSPNLAKEMHVGHLRSTIIGDTFARTLSRVYGEAHYDRVIRQNHLGDWGTQFGRVILGLWYDAVAIKENQFELLSAWISRAKDVPKKQQEETSARAETRRSAEKTLLDAIVPWHDKAFFRDPEGEYYFEGYLQSDSLFPELPRLESLYTFVSTVTEFELAEQCFVTLKDRSKIPYSQLPSLIASFVQNPGGSNEQEAVAWRKSREATLRACEDIYTMLGVALTRKDVKAESDYQKLLPNVVDDLLTKGIAQEDQGAICVFLPDSVDQNGKPVPTIVRKSDGGFNYATTDLAAIKYRVQKLGGQRVIYVVDTRQRDHFRSVFEIARLAGWDITPKGHHAELKHVPFGTVLGENKRPLKTRSGENVKLRSLLDEAIARGIAAVKLRAQSPDAPTHDLPEEQIQIIGRQVGIGAIKYADLSSDLIKDYVFNFDRMLAFEGNTGPYLQYAHARICSIFAKATIDPEETLEWEFAIRQPAEKKLALALLRYGEVVEDVARSLEPHRLCTYLYDLAEAYSGFYQQCPVLAADDEPTRRARLRLCGLVRRVLADALELLGIEAPTRM